MRGPVPHLLPPPVLLAVLVTCLTAAARGVETFPLRDGTWASDHPGVAAVPAAADPVAVPGPETAPVGVEVQGATAPSGRPGVPEVGPGAVLQSCWTPEQLAGSPEDRVIRRGLKPDRTPPPAWAIQAAIQAAERALPALAPPLRGSIRGVEPADPGAQLVALTFDLCEQANERAGYDAELVNTLRLHQVKATFFAGGQWLRSHPEQAMQLMADPRFEVGNHAWTHANLRVVEAATARDQILWTQAQYQVLRRDLVGRACAQQAGPAALAAIPEWPVVFRFPYGTCNQVALETAAALGLPAIQWNLVTGDPDRGRSAQAIARSVLGGVAASRGTILVAHGNGRGWNTAHALSLMIPELKQRGYRFVTVSELLAAGPPVAAQECYEVKPGDNRRYDALFGRGTGR